MPLLSNREGFDKLACQKAQFLIDATVYAGTLRNPAKKVYAQRYAAWRADATDDTFDACADGLTLGYMAQQAVRLDLEHLWKQARP